VISLVAHWEGTDVGPPGSIEWDHAICGHLVSEIQRFHMDSNRWADIGYSWIVCPHGTVYTGRGWSHLPAAQLNANAGRPAVCYLGGPPEVPITRAGREAFVALHREATVAYGRRLPFVCHGDVVATQCPGPDIRAFIESADWTKSYPTEETEMPLTPDEVEAVARRAAQYVNGPTDPALIPEFRLPGWPNVSDQMQSLTDRLEADRQAMASHLVRLETSISHLSSVIEGLVAPASAEAVATALLARLVEALGAAKAEA